MFKWIRRRRRKTIVNLGGGFALAPIGKIKIQNVDDPDAGDIWFFNMPTGKMWRILSLTQKLVTDATAANRNYRLKFTHLGVEFFNSRDSINQTASQTRSIDYLVDYPERELLVNQDGFERNFIPNIWLPEETLISLSANIQVGDQFSDIHILFEERPF